jgi:hypothetical protein
LTDPPTAPLSDAPRLATVLTDAELKEHDHQLSQLTEEVRALLGGLTDAQLNWRPTPERWSIGECLTHLAATADGYLPVLDEGIAHARQSGIKGQGPFRYRWLDRLAVRISEPPPRFRFKSPRAFVPPRPPQTVEGVQRQFLAAQEALRERLRQANGFDLARQRVPSPASRFLSFSLGAAFALLAAHERRHLWQAQRVRDESAFPR